MPKRYLLVSFVAAIGVAGISACSEDLDGGAGCPALCPSQNVELLETVLDPVELDTTLIGLPPLGTAQRLLVASRGDTVLTYGVVRFDVLPGHFRPGTATDSVPIVGVVNPVLRILTDTARRIVTAPIAIELYDVDVTAHDTNTAAIAALVIPERLIGSVTLPQDTTLDTLRIPLDPAVLQQKITDDARLRIAIAIRSAASAQLLVIGLASVADASRITFVPVDETGTEGAELTVSPRSTTPAESPQAAALLTDYTVVARGSPAVPTTELAIGGLPNRRSYIRFDIPTEIIDSSTVVRATLLLTQQRTRGISEDDTIGVYPYIVTAGAAVSDLSRAAMLIAPGSAVGLDSIKVVPNDSGEVAFDIVPLVRGWRGQDPQEIPRAIVLRTGIEGLQPIEVRFFSSDHPVAELRPRLRLTYIPRADFGLP